MGFVHYITKFTILRFAISRFECMQNAYNKHKKDYKRWDGGDFNF